MYGPKPLDDAYVQKHSRPGESWEQARSRLEAEVAERYSLLPFCEICSKGALDIEDSAFEHRRGVCSAALDEWPETALNPRLFDLVCAQSAQQTRVLASLAREQIQQRLRRISVEPHPINALLAARELVGYLGACRAFELFDDAERADLYSAAYAAQERAYEAFIELYLAGDPIAIPWRDAQKSRDKPGLKHDQN